MARYIDADALLKEFANMEVRTKSEKKTDMAFKQGVNWVLHTVVPSEIADAPTIDAVPVVHGEWVEIQYKHFDPPDFPFSEEVDEETGWTFEWDTKTVCSICHYDAANRTPYCPHCGAKMDGGNE